MKHLKKRFLVSLFLMVLAVSSITAYASPVVGPQWSYLTMITGRMKVDDKNYAKITVACSSDKIEVTKVTAKCELQQLEGSWKTIKSWSESSAGRNIAYTKEYGIAKNYNYRLKVTASTYKNSTLLESATEYFDYGYYE
ncbi:MAG: hypothetical protein QM657_07720 [Lacrimispora sp.]|uniref:hypothetical protein n=1 Tax=Lacrimispora sp. TaxID=2719234 RepID=UPI0039E5C03D